MCGIAGIAAFAGGRPPTEPQIRAMCDTIYHRGPDSEGIEVQHNVALGMRRLAIIDLAGGKQPVFNEDKTIRTVFNGEIYNFRELRKQLEGFGHRFQTRSDTEVLVHGYEQWGAELPLHLNGMFTFAIHDIKNRRLLIARDHLGIKPLFYTFNKEHLVWGSEVKVLLASQLVNKDLNIDALGEFLAWEYVPGADTLFTDIRKLEPGCLIDVDLNNPSCNPRTYWDIPQSEPFTVRSDAEWQAMVSDKIDECVQRQLISDVPLGAFLSGGVDSSLVASAMQSAKTFSIGFNEPSYNELSYAKSVANHLGVEHTFEIIEPHVADLFDELMTYMDDPIGDFSIFPTYLVSRLARQHVTVALSGDGGDELFGGYETYVANQAARLYNYLPGVVRQRLISPVAGALQPRSQKKGLINKMKRFVEGASLPPNLGHARWRIFASDMMREDLFTPEALQTLTRPAGAHILNLTERAGERGTLGKSLYVDVKSYLSDNCLVKVDRMSMANSLEARVPMLDRELVELAFQVPDHLKLHKGKLKILLKKIAAERIPTECVYRQKEGFSIPIKHWLGTQFKPLMHDLLDTSAIQSEGIFNAHTIDMMKREHLNGSANHSHVLWSLMVFKAWQRRWLEST